jgi:hypothetical protein
LWNEYIVCLVSVCIVLDFLNLSHYYGIQALKTDSVEQQFMANTAKKVVDDLFWMEGSLQGINAFTAASADGPRKIAMQTTLRASAKSLAMVITEMRLANDLAFDAALCISVPATKYEMLSEEQLKILKKFQKELTASLKAESQKRDRPQPYTGSGENSSGGSGFPQGTCRACDRPGHWQFDNKCKAIDVQRKAARDAKQQFQQQLGASSMMSVQQLPAQFQYSVPSVHGSGAGTRRGGVGNTRSKQQRLLFNNSNYEDTSCRMQFPLLHGRLNYSFLYIARRQ